MNGYIQLCTAVLLGGAAYTDIRYKKIYNAWLALWLLVGVYFRGYICLWNALLATAVLFVFYLFRMIGAGDIKLAALLYGYLGFYDAAFVIGTGMVIAAAYAFYYMYSKGILFTRLLYFKKFLDISLKSNSIQKYYDPQRDKEDITITLAPYFLLGFLIWRLYVLCNMNL